MKVIRTVNVASYERILHVDKATRTKKPKKKNRSAVVIEQMIEARKKQ